LLLQGSPYTHQQPAAYVSTIISGLVDGGVCGLVVELATNNYGAVKVIKNAALTAFIV
jgi:hypothetical protein